MNSIDLPNEILYQVFLQLSPPQLGRCMRVCRQWKTVAEDDTLWSYLFQKNGLLQGLMHGSNLQKIYSNHKYLVHLNFDKLKNFPLEKIINIFPRAQSKVSEEIRFFDANSEIIACLTKKNELVGFSDRAKISFKIDVSKLDPKQIVVDSFDRCFVVGSSPWNNTIAIYDINEWTATNLPTRHVESIQISEKYGSFYYLSSNCFLSKKSKIVHFKEDEESQSDLLEIDAPIKSFFIKDQFAYLNSKCLSPKETNYLFRYDLSTGQIVNYFSNQPVNCFYNYHNFVVAATTSQISVWDIRTNALIANRDKLKPYITRQIEIKDNEIYEINDNHIFSISDLCMKERYTHGREAIYQFKAVEGILFMSNTLGVDVYHQKWI